MQSTTTLVGCLYREDQVPERKPNIAERAGILEDYIPQPPRFVTTRCPKCQRLTSYLSFQGAPVVMCTWTNCGHTWIELQQRLRDSDD